MTVIREYDSQLDAATVRACFVALQEAERQVEPGLPPGEDIVDAYLAQMFQGCEKGNGRVFIAESDNAGIGFVCAYARVCITDADEAPKEVALISDIAVLPQYRGQGIGRRLLEHADHFVRENGAITLRLVVLSRNTGARKLYAEVGFPDRWVQMTKALD